MIDFTDLPMRKKTYSGANGSKISVVYQDELYMLKFPAQPTKNPALSYTNSCISEYLGCKIYKSVGIPVQEVLLGEYRTPKGSLKTVVACKDFTSPGIVLQDFASMKNQIVDSVRNGYGTELSDILDTFEQQTSMDSTVLKERFWDMFIVDALIGNWDRHNGNWGFLYNTQTDELTLAPVFACGSSLFPQADEAIMRNILSDKNAMNQRIFNQPRSAISQDGKKINYFDFISSLDQPDCNAALKRIVPRMDMNQIRGIVEATPGLSELQKQFFTTMLTMRKERILDYALEKLHNLERSPEVHSPRTHRAHEELER